MIDDYLGICTYTPPNKSNKCKKTNNKINATKQTKNYLAAVEALFWSTVNDTIFSLPMLSIYLNLLKCIISNQQSKSFSIFNSTAIRLVQFISSDFQIPFCLKSKIVML